MPALRTLKKRAEFLGAARGHKHVRPELLVQLRRRDDSPVTGVGFTASKKVGGAVARNRAKRRMRAIARELLPELGRPGCDYVLIARQSTATCEFGDLRRAMSEACRHLHQRLGAA